MSHFKLCLVLLTSRRVFLVSASSLVLESISLTLSSSCLLMSSLQVTSGYK